MSTTAWGPKQSVSAKSVVVRMPLVIGEFKAAAIVAAASLLASASSPTAATSINPYRIDGSAHTASVAARDREDGLWLSAAMAEIKRRSGTTWDDLARLFEVSRRTIHTWASGGSISLPRRERVEALLDRVRKLNDVRPMQVRKELLTHAGLAIGRPLPTSEEPAIMVVDDRSRSHMLKLSDTGAMKIIEA